jgi:single-stranded DNA-binding protein
MIDALIAGRLCEKPDERRTKHGRRYAVASVRVFTGDGEPEYITAFAFRPEAAQALVALESGDSVACTGELKFTKIIDRSGFHSQRTDLIVHALLSTYHINQKRRAADDPYSEAIADHARRY